MNESVYNTEKDFNRDQTLRLTALTNALAAECSALLHTLNMPKPAYSENEAPKELFGMIKELHSQIVTIKYETFQPTQTITQIPPAPPALVEDDEIPF